MIDNICESLTKKIRMEMPEIDEERAEIIKYGLENIIGEIPKIFIMLILAYSLGIIKETIITILIIMPYRAVSGGFHLNTHLGCIISTCTFYCGTAIISKHLEILPEIRYILLGLILIFGIIMLKKYAPADTINVPILRKKERRRKKILSYIILSSACVIAAIFKDNIISNIVLIGYFIQTCTITEWAYKITNNKYGYEIYKAS